MNMIWLQVTWKQQCAHTLLLQESPEITGLKKILYFTGQFTEKKWCGGASLAFWNATLLKHTISWDISIMWYSKVKCLSVNFLLTWKYEISVLLALNKMKECKVRLVARKHYSEDCFSFTDTTQNEAVLIRGKGELWEPKSQWLDLVVVHLTLFPDRFLRNLHTW